MEIESINDESNVKYEPIDLTRPLEGDCWVELLDFSDPLGKMVFWHSSAHILGSSLEQCYGGHLCIGPPLQNGFYYDCYMGENKLTDSHYSEIEAQCAKNTKANQRFERLVITKDQALEMFGENEFKKQLIMNKIKDGEMTTTYRCGDLVDLCTGPHLINSSKIKALKVTKNSSSYWMSNAKNDSLQRVYAISFPQEKQMKEYEKIQKELAKYDHRIIGKQ